MSTAYIYNGFGHYEKKNGVEGLTLTYGGVPFFLAYKQVTPIPDWTFREVDHDKTSPDGEGEGVLTYKSFSVNGKRVCEELLMTQIPTKNSDKGIIEVEGKQTGRFLSIASGYTAEGQALTAEVREVVATKSEESKAEILALEYKKHVIQEYFQSKRERMAGGKGQLFPIGHIKVFMDELDIEDIDDVMKHQRTSGGMDPETLKVILEFASKGREVTAAAIEEAVAKVRKAGKAQLAPGKGRSQGLDAYKEAYDSAIEEGRTPEEAKELAKLATA